MKFSEPMMGADFSLLLLLLLASVCAVLAEGSTTPLPPMTPYLKENEEHSDGITVRIENGTYGFERRQDGGFDFMNYFIHGGNQQVQEQQAAPVQKQTAVVDLGQLLGLRQPQQHHPLQPPPPQQIQIQPHQLLQLQQYLQQQQQLQQQRTQQDPQQDHQQIQQQPQSAQQLRTNQNPGGEDLSQAHQQPQPQIIVASRNGPYSGGGGGGGFGGIFGGDSYGGGHGEGDYGGNVVGYSGNSYGGHQSPKGGIGIHIGGKKPGNIIQGGSFLSIIPRIAKVLSSGGKVMLGAELGKNFYFGPIGAKPLHQG